MLCCSKFIDIKRRKDWSYSESIVDDTEKFTYVYSGQPGSMHDARVLRQSSFWRDAINVSCLRCDILKQLLTIVYF